MLAAIIATTLILNKIDALLIGKKTVSVIMFPFMTMNLYGTCFPGAIDWIGYAISCLVICASYIAVVALYRKKQYKVWYMKKDT